MNTYAGLMARVISMMFLRGKKDQFVIKMVWLVLQLTSVGEDSKSGTVYQILFFFWILMKRYQSPLDEK